jgi:hypothetical protein
MITSSTAPTASHSCVPSRYDRCPEASVRSPTVRPVTAHCYRGYPQAGAAISRLPARTLVPSCWTREDAGNGHAARRRRSEPEPHWVGGGPLGQHNAYPKRNSRSAALVSDGPLNPPARLCQQGRCQSNGAVLSGGGVCASVGRLQPLLRKCRSCRSGFYRVFGAHPFRVPFPFALQR